MSVTSYILVFLAVCAISILIKLSFTPQKRAYKVKWDESVGVLHPDFKYGKSEADKFDLYVPADSTRESYGLVVYLHGGSFSNGDKKDDTEILKWLCAKGYVAAGINYSLNSSKNPVSVYEQSQDIKAAMPKVIAKAERLGYRIDSMAIAGGSAGGTLALLYALRDGGSAPVPVKMLFAVSAPAGFHHEDWTNYGLDKNPRGAAELFSGMCGNKITAEMIESGDYIKAVKNISPDMWVSEKAAPMLLAYGKRDTICPCATAQRLVGELEKHGVPHDYIEFPHSGHGLQNDDKLYKKYFKKLNEYLDAYLPVK